MLTNLSIDQTLMKARYHQKKVTTKFSKAIQDNFIDLSKKKSLTEINFFKQT